VLHPSSGIWLAGSVRFSIWLDWFRKIGHLAKTWWRDSQNPIHKKRLEKVLRWGDTSVGVLKGQYFEILSMHA
jgi:hypothetical protein